MSAVSDNREEKQTALNSTIQYGCSMCGNIFQTEEVCDEHIANCAQNTPTSPDLEETSRASKRKLDHCEARIFEDSSSDTSDDERECKRVKEQQEFIAVKNTVYEATSQMISENEMLITLPYDEQINDSIEGPLDFSNEVAIGFEQHTKEIDTFEHAFNPCTYRKNYNESTVATIDNYNVEDFSSLDKDCTIKILSVFTTKPSQKECESKYNDNMAANSDNADSESNKVLTVLNNVDVNQLKIQEGKEMTVINIGNHTESFELEREMQSEYRDGETLRKSRDELGIPVVEKDTNTNPSDPQKQSPNSSRVNKHQPMTGKKRSKKMDSVSIVTKPNNSKNFQNLNKKLTEQQGDKHRKEETNKVKCNSENRDQREKLLYSFISREEKEVVEEQPNELSVYEFYDEEDEKRKAEMQEEIEKQKELKKRTCKYCKEVFKDPMDVLRHNRQFHKFEKIILTKEELEPYLKHKNRKQCPICFKTLGSKVYPSVYMKHLGTHCDEYNYECRVCHMQFRRKDHWSNHEIRHVVNPESAEKD